MYFSFSFIFFFFHATATTEIYTLSLHDALPIAEHLLEPLGLLAGFHQVDVERVLQIRRPGGVGHLRQRLDQLVFGDRKSTRLNSSHSQISYAVFCLKKKKQQNITRRNRLQLTLT